MSLTRRLLIRLGLLSPLGLAAGSAQSAAISGRAAAALPPDGAMAAWVDTLLPDFRDFPAASSLGLHRYLLAQAAQQPALATLLSRGLAWCDARARESGFESFLAADGATREQIASRAERGQVRSDERRFFSYTLNRCQTLYYTSPESWAALAYQGPPQPQGYMDFADPPPS